MTPCLNEDDTRIANPHSASKYIRTQRIFLLCYYFAITQHLWENESRHVGRNEMAGLKGGSGPPGNMDAFKHGLAAIQKRREESVTTEHEESVRQQILDGLIVHKGGDEQVSTATRMYRCFSVMGDAYAGLTFVTDFASHGISYYVSELTN